MCMRAFLIAYSFWLLNVAIIEAGATRPVPVRKPCEIIPFPVRAA